MYSCIYRIYTQLENAAATTTAVMMTMTWTDDWRGDGDDDNDRDDIMTMWQQRHFVHDDSGHERKGGEYFPVTLSWWRRMQRRDDGDNYYHCDDLIWHFDGNKSWFWTCAVMMLNIITS